MTLLTAGYWPTTYWAEDFWQGDYWSDYGAVTAEFLLLALSQVGMVNFIQLQAHMLNLTFSQEVAQ